MMCSYIINLRGLHSVMLSEKKVKEKVCIIPLFVKISLCALGDHVCAKVHLEKCLKG